MLSYATLDSISDGDFSASYFFLVHLSIGVYHEPKMHSGKKRIHVG
jgi:hypothetical protein